MEGKNIKLGMRIVATKPTKPRTHSARPEWKPEMDRTENRILTVHKIVSGYCFKPFCMVYVRENSFCYDGEWLTPAPDLSKWVPAPGSKVRIVKPQTPDNWWKLVQHTEGQTLTVRDINRYDMTDYLDITVEENTFKYELEWLEPVEKAFDPNETQVINIPIVEPEDVIEPYEDTSLCLVLSDLEVKKTDIRVIAKPDPPKPEVKKVGFRLVKEVATSSSQYDWRRYYGEDCEGYYGL